VPRGLAKVDGADQVHADIALGVPTANREDQPRSQLLNTVPQPSSFVRAVNSETLSTGEYASIAQLAEIIDRMAAVAGAALDAQQ
jgi:hypothetical protein